jgi:hypothetical protein
VLITRLHHLSQLLHAQHRNSITTPKGKFQIFLKKYNISAYLYTRRWS